MPPGAVGDEGRGERVRRRASSSGHCSTVEEIKNIAGSNQLAQQRKHANTLYQEQFQ
jgi:hypothetical protein